MSTYKFSPRTKCTRLLDNTQCDYGMTTQWKIEKIGLLVSKSQLHQGSTVFLWKKMPKQCGIWSHQWTCLQVTKSRPTQCEIVLGNTILEMAILCWYQWSWRSRRSENWPNKIKGFNKLISPFLTDIRYPLLIPIWLRLVHRKQMLAKFFCHILVLPYTKSSFSLLQPWQKNVNTCYYLKSWSFSLLFVLIT